MPLRGKNLSSSYKRVGKKFFPEFFELKIWQDKKREYLLIKKQ
jgi:hypothetical protein